MSDALDEMVEAETQAKERAGQAVMARELFMLVGLGKIPDRAAQMIVASGMSRAGQAALVAQGAEAVMAKARAIAKARDAEMDVTIAALNAKTEGRKR